MQFPESWLRHFIDPDLGTDELAHVLTMAGLEVEETYPAAPMFSDVVVARIATIEPHPDADRLRVCHVDDGSGESLQVVCGAPNVAAGMLVPLARVGAQLPGGIVIGRAKMRGVVSSGMLCSGQELGISQDHDGLLVLDPSLQPGQNLRTALQLDDMCFELKLTPNRADCLSIYGVAREVAALTGAPLASPCFDPVPVSINDTLKVDVRAPDLCGRFAGRVIRGVNSRAATPGWMAERLVRSGQRPVSALVDISNYVMLELGRPTHVFDFDQIDGPLHVRWAEKGEALELLNGQLIELNENMGVIATEHGPESLAGIMGGAATAVSLDTTNIYLEGAFWWPQAVMGQARQLKIPSEASHRFERGVDAESVIEHLELTSRLILDICGGQAGPLEDECLTLPKREPVQLRLARCNKVLGVPLGTSEIKQIFDRLGFKFDEQNDVFTVVPPSWRFDLQIEEDLIEEVARIYGFERIPDRPPVAQANMLRSSETTRSAHQLRAAMAALDYQEVINFSFVEERWETDYVGNNDPIRLLNPIASQLAVMRSSLIGGLLSNIEHNAHHRQTRVRVFEIGRVFWRDPNVLADDLAVAGVNQPTHMAGAAWGPSHAEQWGLPEREVDFYDVKRDIEALLGRQASQLVCVADTHPALHPGRSARLVLAGRDIGWLGQVHPQWARDLDLQQSPVVFEIDLAALTSTELPFPRSLSRQPVVVRDLAVWVEADVSFQQLLDSLKATIETAPELAIIKDIKLFDVWRDKAAQSNEKSLAMRFWLQSPDSTLDEATVQHCMDILLNTLVANHNARLRA